ncbi:MAG: cation:proton antiporter [Myxococcales bacterium]|nr:cation:proton antiporter [Myxococcales bacterium]
MDSIPLLEEIAVVGAAAVLVTVVLGRLRLPTVAGLLLSGALIGPHGVGLVSDTHDIEVMAEVGVVLLLFTIGLELSLARLRNIFRHVALGGLLQVAGTVAAVALIARWGFDVPTGPAIFYGFVFALSSTAIVLRGLSERRELDAPHGRFIVGALIFQDLCVVPMVLLVPLLAALDASAGAGEGAGGGAAEVALALGKAAVVVVGVLGVSRLLVPRLLGWVAASRSREVFLLAVLTICVGTAWLTSLAGLSLALGAFLGGLVVADTEHSHRAMGDVLPLRDVFVSFFFVSLGMFFQLDVVVEHPLLVLALLLGFVVGKGALATAAAMLMRFPPRAAWLAGAGLAQFGEFGFVLVRLGTRDGLVHAAQVDPLLNAGILSMFFTPLLLHVAPHLTAGERLLGPLAKLLRARSIEAPDATREALEDHVVLIGYGVAGRLVAGALRSVGALDVILELNVDNVHEGRAAGDPVYYADATSEEALGHAHVAQARCVVVLINDPNAVLRVVATVRRVAPGVPILLRTRYLGEQKALMSLGASSVVADEVEGGIEVLARVLRELDVPHNRVEAEIRKARAATQRSVRATDAPDAVGFDGESALSGLKVESVAVVPGSAAQDRSPRELDLRAKTGATLIAIRRGTDVRPVTGPGEPLREGDVAYFIGEAEAVRAAVQLLSAPPGAAESAAS